MTRSAPKASRRSFRTRWSVILFVIIGVVVCSAIMLWRLSHDSADEPDSTLRIGAS